MVSAVFFSSHRARHNLSFRQNQWDTQPSGETVTEPFRRAITLKSLGPSEGSSKTAKFKI